MAGFLDKLSFVDRHSRPLRAIPFRLFARPYTPTYTEIATCHSRPESHRLENSVRPRALNVGFRTTIWNTMGDEGLAILFFAGG